MSDDTEAPLRTRYRHSLLFAVLVAVITVPPFLPDSTLRIVLVEGLLLMTLLVGSYTTLTSPRSFAPTAALATVAVASRVGWWFHPTNALLFGFLGGYLAFFAVVAGTLVRHLFTSRGRISADTLCGALAVYLVLGILWAYAFSILETAQPGSFTFGGQQALSDARFERFLGFSFTTLTTLGYGNVSPATPKADALSILEAITGQCYLAIAIARLVALQIAQFKP